MYNHYINKIKKMQQKVEQHIKELDESTELAMKSIYALTRSEMIRDHKKITVEVNDCPKPETIKTDVNTGEINIIRRTTVRGSYQFELCNN